MLFLIHSANLCHLIDEFKPFMVRVNIDRIKFGPVILGFSSLCLTLISFTVFNGKIFVFVIVECG